MNDFLSSVKYHLYRKKNIYILGIIFLISEILILISFSALKNSFFQIYGGFILILFKPGLIMYYLVNRNQYKYKSLYLIVLFSVEFWILLSFCFFKLKILLNIKSLIWVNYILTGVILIIVLLDYFRIKRIMNLKQISEKFNRETFSSNINFVLFNLFLLLLGIFLCIRVPFTAFDDSWFHLRLANEYLTQGIPKLNQYNNKYAYHFIVSAFGLLSKTDLILICRFIGVVQVFLAGIVFRDLLFHIYPQKNITLIISMMFITSTLGNIIIYSQFWPTSITSLLFLHILVIFFQKIENLNAVKNGKRKPRKMHYILILWHFIAISIVHSLNGLIFSFFLLAPVGILIIFNFKLFLKDFIFLLGNLIIFILFNLRRLVILFNWSNSFFISRNLFMILLLVIILVLISIWFLKFIKHNTYSFQKQESIFKSDNTTIKIELSRIKNLIIIPFVIASPILYYLLIVKLKNFFPANPIVATINSSFICLYIINGVLGILIFRAYSATGKTIFIQLITFVLLVLGLIILGTIHSYIVRIVELFVPFIFIGNFLRYSFHHISNKKQVSRKKLSLSSNKWVYSWIILTIALSIIYEASFNDFISINEYNLLETTGFKVDNNESVLIIGNFHYEYPYDYLIQKYNFSIDYSSEYTSLVFPSNWTIQDSSIQEFNYLKDKNNFSSIIILISPYDTTRGYTGIDQREITRLDESIIYIYPSLSYFNRIGVNLQKNSFYCYN